MKTANFKKELQHMQPHELVVKLDALRREKFTLHLNATTAPDKDYSKFSKVRRDIARVLTELRRKGIK